LPPSSTEIRAGARWQDKQRDEEGSAIPEKGPTFGGRPRADARGATLPRSSAQDCYLPGNPAADYRTVKAAKLIPAGYDIFLNVHYTPNGHGLHGLHPDRLHCGQGAAGEALRFPAHFGSDGSRTLCYSTQQWKLAVAARGGQVLAGRRVGLPDAPHARSRKGHEVDAGVPGWKKTGDSGCAPL
jgi:hypothetical protein